MVRDELSGRELIVSLPEALYVPDEWREECNEGAVLTVD